MSYRIRSIDYTADHRRIVRDRMIDKVTLAIGRIATNDIALPDLAVEPQHAVMSLVGPARVSVKASGTLGFEIDGRSTQAATIDATAGAELRFGSHRLGIRRDDDGVILIEVESLAASGAPPDPAEDKRGFSLHSAVKAKRAIAWAAVIAILALFLAWPIASHMAHKPVPGPTAVNTVSGDKAWNPGPLSLAHQDLSQRCEACHVKAFQSVRNETCQGCHKDVKDHADPARILEAHGRAGLSQAMLNRISATFGREKPGACTDCHVEHQGKQAMALPAQQFCSDCHATLREKLPDTRLGDASDFGKLHPEFTALIVNNAERGTRARVALDAHPREDSGLLFSHRIHLDPNGGVARMAGTLGGAGYSGPLDCQNCHQRSADGVSFRPVSMENNCEACHSLAYNKAGSVVLKLRHGDLDQAIADLRRAGPQPVMESTRSRPGEFASGGLYHARFAAPVASSDPLAKNGICGECHTRVIRNGKEAVGHVRLTSRYLPNGWFDHSAHAQTACTDCHAAKASDKASDVLVPGLAKCRDCHLGEGAPAPKIASGCVMCHVYHATAAAPNFTRRHRPGVMSAAAMEAVPAKSGR